MSPKCNRLDNVVRGKGKKGAQVAGDKSVMAVIETEGGGRFKVLSNVRGKVRIRRKYLFFFPKLYNSKFLIRLSR